MTPSRVQSTLTADEDGGYTYTLPSQDRYNFDTTGRLSAAGDPNGDEPRFGYDGSGRLRTMTDPAGRSLVLAYNADGTVARATDPAGQQVTYGYQDGSLVSVTRRGEDHPRWRFGYDAEHQMTSMTDGLGTRRRPRTTPSTA